MKFLIDKAPHEVERRQQQHPEFVMGQLCTPLTRNLNWGGSFALDNGGYSGFEPTRWFRLLQKHESHLDHCLFCAIPDIVGNARRTDELYGLITRDKRTHAYTEKWAWVMQDGHEDKTIYWDAIRWLFIGGTDRFKDSSAAWDIVKTAKALGIPVHVGRVNTAKRYIKYAELGADTCDGNGIGRYDHMLESLVKELNKEPEPRLF